MEPKKTHNKTISDPSTWVDRHGDYLFRFAMSRLRDETLSEDVVQETLLAALKARESFQGKSDERTWFVGILKRKVIDYFRKAGREVDIDDETAVFLQDTKDFKESGSQAGSWKTGRKPLDWQIDAGDAAETKEFWQFLSWCLDNLPHNMSLVFVMREMEHMASDEICNVLEVSPTNLRVLLHRARKQLRSCLEKQWIGTRS